MSAFYESEKGGLKERIKQRLLHLGAKEYGERKAKEKREEE